MCASFVKERRNTQNKPRYQSPEGEQVPYGAGAARYGVQRGTTQKKQPYSYRGEVAFLFCLCYYEVAGVG